MDAPCIDAQHLYEGRQFAQPLCQLQSVAQPNSVGGVIVILPNARIRPFQPRNLTCPRTAPACVDHD
jgi:hypothetical protein